jgi:hypothetical protein
MGRPLFVGNAHAAIGDFGCCRLVTVDESYQCLQSRVAGRAIKFG